jgi:hypothetical protein
MKKWNIFFGFDLLMSFKKKTMFDEFDNEIWLKNIFCYWNFYFIFHVHIIVFQVADKQMKWIHKNAFYKLLNGFSCKINVCKFRYWDHFYNLMEFDGHVMPFFFYSNKIPKIWCWNKLFADPFKKWP